MPLDDRNDALIHDQAGARGFTYMAVRASSEWQSTFRRSRPECPHAA
jgi:hypothetical protein